MLNKLFSKLEKAMDIKVTIAPEEAKGKSIDQQINEAVYSAQDILLQEAKLVLEQVKTDDDLQKPVFNSSYPQDKVDLLNKMKSLGFTNSKEVRSLKAEIDEYNTLKEEYEERLAEYDKKRLEAEELKERIEYYSKAYPNHKFITKDSIKKICNQFGLLMAPSGLYVDDIPEKNMKEMIDFKVKDFDALSKAIITASYWKIGLYDQVTTEEMISSEEYSFIKNRNEEYIYPSRIENFLPYRLSEDMRDIHRLEVEDRNPDEKGYIELNSPLMIAPKNKFELPENYKVEEGFEVGFRKVVEIKDPVVLQPVKGGYLIVTSWGFEATLPEINNGNAGNISNNLN